MIPGMKIINDILSGIPDNARLRGQLQELRSQMTVLQRENEELKTKVAELEAKPKFSDQSIAILDLIYDRPDELTDEDISATTRIKLRDVRYHLSKLEKENWIYSPGDHLSAPKGYGITNDGIDVIKRHKT